MIVQVENTSTCQAACHFCVYPEANRAGGQMDMDLFRKIVDQSPDVGVRKFVIHGLGEPLLDRKLEERIAYVHKTLYGVPVEIFTNGQFLTPKRFLSLKEAGISEIVVSLNAVRADQHFEIMKLRCFDKTCEQLDEIIPQLDHVRLEIHAVQDNDTFTKEDNLEFRKRWGDLAEVFLMGNWAGDKATIRPFDPNEYCIRSDQTIYITYDGKMTPCCFMPKGDVHFGDLNHYGLKEVYYSDEYKAFRRAHRENRAADYDYCKTCNRI